jgi:hypothetical protein
MRAPGDANQSSYSRQELASLIFSSAAADRANSIRWHGSRDASAFHPIASATHSKRRNIRSFDDIAPTFFREARVFECQQRSRRGFSTKSIVGGYNSAAFQPTAQCPSGNTQLPFKSCRIQTQLGPLIGTFFNCGVAGSSQTRLFRTKKGNGQLRCCRGELIT